MTKQCPSEQQGLDRNAEDGLDRFSDILLKAYMEISRQADGTQEKV